MQKTPFPFPLFPANAIHPKEKDIPKLHATNGIQMT